MKVTYIYCLGQLDSLYSGIPTLGIPLVLLHQFFHVQHTKVRWVGQLHLYVHKRQRILPVALRDLQICTILGTHENCLGFVFCNVAQSKYQVHQCIHHGVLPAFHLGASVSISILWRFMFSLTGLVNTVLGKIGIPAIPFLEHPDYALFTISLLVVWSLDPRWLSFWQG